MADSMDDIMNPGSRESDPDFPSAPEGWNRSTAEEVAKKEGLNISDDHWDMIHALQNYFATHDKPSVRELHDALAEKFHHKGGMSYLYKLLPAGPIAQGCRLAGIQPPAGTVDKGFGSVI